MGKSQKIYSFHLYLTFLPTVQDVAHTIREGSLGECVAQVKLFFSLFIGCGQRCKSCSKSQRPLSPWLAAMTVPVDPRHVQDVVCCTFCSFCLFELHSGIFVSCFGEKGKISNAFNKYITENKIYRLIPAF